MEQPRIRSARAEDLEPVLAMQAASFRTLGGAFYPADAIAAFLAEAGTMDPRLIGEGSFFVAGTAARIVGSAGFTLRTPNYARFLAAVPAPLPARCGRATTVRSVFVTPGFARRGLGRALMTEVEVRMHAAGIATGELMATLSVEPLYRALGWLAIERHELGLAGGRIGFVTVRMVKPLAPGAALSRAA